MVAGIVSMVLFFLLIVVPCIAKAFEREEYVPPPIRPGGTPW